MTEGNAFILIRPRIDKIVSRAVALIQKERSPFSRTLHITDYRDKGTHIFKKRVSLQNLYLHLYQ